MLRHSPGGRYGVPNARLQAGQWKKAIVAGLEQKDRIQREWRPGICSRLKSRHDGCDRLQTCLIPQSFARERLVGENQGTEVNTLVASFLGYLIYLICFGRQMLGRLCLPLNEKSIRRR